MSQRSYTDHIRHPAMSHLLELEEEVVEPLGEHRQTADCLALVAADLATEEELSVLKQRVSGEVAREGLKPLVTRLRTCRPHQTPFHASKHPCGEQKSQCQYHSPLHTQ